MSNFDLLLGELEMLAKSKPDADDKADDDKIKAAADGDQDDDGEKDYDDIPDDYEGHDEPDGDEDDDGDGMKKSFLAYLEDGTEVEAVDGTLLVKALQDEVTTHAESFEHMAKALRQVTDLLKSQQAETAALRRQMRALADSGRGRKSILNVHEKPAVIEQPAAPTVTRREIMAKAMSQLKAGNMTGFDVARLEGYLNGQREIPGDLLAKIG